MEEKKELSPLAKAELETLEEAREWGRRRLRKKLEKLAKKQGEFSPLQQREIDSLTKAFDPFKDDNGRNRR